MAHASITTSFTREVNINGLTFKNYQGSNQPVLPMILNQNIPYAPITMNDISLIDSDLQLQSFFGGDIQMSSLILEDINFSNISIGPDTSIFFLVSFQVLNVSNFTLESIESTEPRDTGSSIFALNNFELNGNGGIEISDINYSNSSVTFMKFSSLSESATSTKY